MFKACLLFAVCMSLNCRGDLLRRRAHSGGPTTLGVTALPILRAAEKEQPHCHNYCHTSMSQIPPSVTDIQLEVRPWDFSSKNQGFSGPTN